MSPEPEVSRDFLRESVRPTGRMMQMPSAPLTGERLAQFRETKRRLEAEKAKREDPESAAVHVGRGAHFDRGLKMWVKNDAHRRDVMRRHNLVEVGNL